ncbi:MAG: nicotinate-nucleotide adenylyltransferase [Aquificaceae bacterium]|nr:nicotinate-nucleotide adenylyltransferase [Aquificaceae bacterium]
MRLFFGGSFDPVHVGHLLVARDVKEDMGFEKVVFLPAFQAPLKEPHGATPEDRLQMLRLSLRGFEDYEISEVEIRRGGVSYTVDTAEELHRTLGERPFFLLGADSFLSLHLWKEPVLLTRLARFLVVDREGMWKKLKVYLAENFPHLKEGKDLFILTVRRIDLSSTEIRERVRRGKSIRWMVPEGVEDYIRDRGLYL